MIFVLAQGRREVQRPGLEADGAGVGDALDDEVTRILERRQRAGVRAGRRVIQGTRCAAAQELMRALVVVLLSKAVECALLGGERGARGANRAPLQGLMHAFVGTVLLGVRGQDPLVLNAQTQPPHVERREAVQRRGGEGHTVVGPHRPRQPVLTEEPIENGPHPYPLTVTDQPPETRALRDRRRWSYAPRGLLLAVALKRPVHLAR